MRFFLLCGIEPERSVLAVVQRPELAQPADASFDEQPMEILPLA